MKWQTDQTELLKLETDSLRKDWMESKAYDAYFDMEWKMPKAMRNPSRMGALGIFEMTGTEGKNCWMVPIEGHKKLLSPQAAVQLLEKDGTVFFDGKWSEVDNTAIQSRTEFFIWLKPKDREEAELSFTTRLKGLYRLTKHKIFGKN